MSALGKLTARHDVQRGLGARREVPAHWGLDFIAGSLVELSAKEGGSLSAAASLIREAQRRGEHVAWIGLATTPFYPLDLAATGVDLDALPVVLLPRLEAIPFAADLLIRSGAFAMLILDLGTKGDLRLSLQTRLMGLARKHDTALLCLTEKSRQTPSLSSLVTVRAEVRHRKVSDGRYACEVEIIRDKRRRIGGKHSELRRAPAGLC